MIFLQGSVLRPTLLLILINDLLSVTAYVNIRFFTDEFNFCHTFTADQGEIENLKTNFISNSRTNKRCMNDKPINAGDEIKEVDFATFVWLNIDRHLSWNGHIRFVNQIRKKVAVLLRLRHFVPRPTLILFVNTFIQPLISYGIEVWRSTYKPSFRSILYLQKMAFRALIFSEWRTRKIPLFKRLRILNLYNLHDLSISAFMFYLVTKIQESRNGFQTLKYVHCAYA